MTPRLRDGQSSDERSVDCMNHEDPNDGKQTADGVRFIQTLFDPDDTILARLIEIWTDAGKKQSRADHQGTWYGRGGERLGDGEWDWIPAGSPASLDTRLGRIKARSGQERTNIFFGVCPRHGSQHFDQAWQIRKVRCLWADIDHVTVEEALERCRAAGLPQPSIVVNSGNGVHLYWLLVEPYLIDDAGGDPIPVYTEFEDQGPAKKKKPRKYIIDPTTQERLYLDVKANVPPLSRKAQFVQDVLAGLASKIGGDHTTDLSRLLRIPGTKNRKDQRNGREPVPCTLIECDPSRRYPIEQFAQFVESSPQKAHRETVAKVKLPAPRKLSPKGTDKFNELVLACSTAPVGTRSEADFALCCWSVEHGVSREDVRTAVAGIGKFAERPDYFDRTWNAAEQNTRENILAKVHGGQVAKAPLSNHDAPAGDDDGIGAKDDRIRGLADAICAQHQFAQDSSGCLYRFEKGVYKPTGKELVKRLVKQLCLEFNATADWSPSLANDVVEFIRVDSPLLWEQPPLDVLNVKNGLLRLSDRVLVPHSPDHLSPVQLPVEFDPSATCPAIEAFVNQVFPLDAIMLAWEIVAWLMLPYTAIQKAILLLGPGGNGKSVWLRLLIAFLGKINTSGLSLHKLEADRFAASRLYGKLANICPDLPSEHLAGTSMFKAITGGDPITGEYKFRDSFEFTPYARLVFSANNAPRSQDSSQGFFDRWVVILFGRSFRGTADEIPSSVLDARLQAPRELSGLLNKALDALPRIDGKCGFTMPASVQAAAHEFQATTDPLAVWLDRHTVEDSGAYIPRTSLRLAFNAYMEEQGKPTMTETAFGTAFRKHRPGVQDKQRTVGGRLQWCYVGIAAAENHSSEHGGCEAGSHPSQGSRGFPTCYLSHAEKSGEQKEVVQQEQDRANPVNPVNPVDGNHGCQHEWHDSGQESDGRNRRYCRTCCKFAGFVQPDGSVVPP